MIKRIAVTGGSGKAGKYVIQEFLDRGYDVRNIDWNAPKERLCPFLKTDLTDYGQTIEALANCDAVAHLAAIPAPGILPPAETFRINTLSTNHVFSAAQLHKMQRVVWASSETTLGLPFEKVKPQYAPVDESHFPYPESSYALSKVVGEQMAEQFSRWMGIPFVSLRLSNVMEPHDYEKFSTFQDNPRLRAWNCWGYIDARDSAQAFRLSIEKQLSGHHPFIIAARDTVMNRTNLSLLNEVFPNAEHRKQIENHETLLSIDKAKALLGYAPQFSWRDHV